MFCEKCGANVSPTSLRCPHCQAVLRHGGISDASSWAVSPGDTEDFPEFEPLPEKTRRRWVRSRPAALAFVLLLVAMIMLTTALVTNHWFETHMEYGSSGPMMVDWDMGLSEIHFVRENDPRWFGYDLDGTYDSDKLIEDASYLTTQDQTELAVVIALLFIILGLILIGHQAFGLFKLPESFARYLAMVLLLVPLLLLSWAVFYFRTYFPGQVEQELEDFQYSEFGNLESSQLGFSFYLAMVATFLVISAMVLMLYRRRTYSQDALPYLPKETPVFPVKQKRSMHLLPLISGLVMAIAAYLIIQSMVSESWMYAESSIASDGISRAYALETEFGLYKMDVTSTYGSSDPSDSQRFLVEFDEDHRELSDESIGINTLWALFVGAAIALAAAVFSIHIGAGAFTSRPKFRRWAPMVIGLVASVIVFVALVYFATNFSDGIYETQESDDLTTVLDVRSGAASTLGLVGAICMIIGTLIAGVWVVTMPVDDGPMEHQPL
jgi:protein-S-isoprenylcysteine O-methyltransferase Ste14